MTSLTPAKSRFTHPSHIKAGVIGYGHSGRRLKEMKAAGMTPTVVVDPDPARREVAAAEHPGIEVYASVEEMLSQSDANLLTIVTPHNLHAPLAMQCLQAGRHVVCEKPMALTTRECDELIDCARANDVFLSAYHNRHWDGCILRAVDQVKKQKIIGEIVRIDARVGSHAKPGDDWRNSRRISGGILYDWGVHLLEFTLQLITTPITEVTGFCHHGYWAPHTRWKEDTIEDEAHLAIRFEGGAWANLTVTQIDSNPKPGFFEITGTQGSYLIDFRDYTLIKVEGGRTVIEKGPHYENQFQQYFDNVSAHLSSGADLVITPEWARRPVHILDLAIESAREGRSIRARYP